MDAEFRRNRPIPEDNDRVRKVVEVFLNVSEILAFVWGPLKFLLMITSNFSDAFNSLLDTYQEIGEQIPLLESFKTLFQDSVNTHMRQLLVLIYEDILRFQLLALRYFRKKMWKQLFVASWGGFKSEIKLLKDNLGRHRRLIESRASLTQFEEVLNIRANAEKYFKELKDGENRRRREAVFRWLSSADVEAVHEQTCRRQGLELAIVQLASPGAAVSALVRSHVLPDSATLAQWQAGLR
ncbi:hypothetical protein MCOR02_012446 [Pyricularia oryzae]|nr:hypothetical protein MCOR02_012446 [Pyricularia oryzae]